MNIHVTAECGMAVAFDQRNVVRPAAAQCDLGAYEYVTGDVTTVRSVLTVDSEMLPSVLPMWPVNGQNC